MSGFLVGHSIFPSRLMTHPENALESYSSVVIAKWGGAPSYMKCTISASSQTNTNGSANSPTY
jgi:hypothetical protein